MKLKILFCTNCEWWMAWNKADDHTGIICQGCRKELTVEPRILYINRWGEFQKNKAPVAQLVDAADLKSSET